jgi:lambda family phage portal protein
MALWGRKQKDKIAHGNRRTSRQRQVRQRVPSRVPVYRKPKLPQRGVRAFDAAKAGRLTDGWTQTPLPIDEHIRQSWTALVARSRNIRMNSDHGRRLDSLTRSNVIGPQGIRLQAQAGAWGRDKGTKSPRWILDGPANDAIETAWKEWAEPGNCEVSGHLGLVDVQSLGISTERTDGDFLLRILRGEPGGEFGPFGFMVQVIDPMWLPVELNADNGGDTYIRMGVERNRWGRPVAYHIRDESRNAGTWLHYETNRHYRRIPADEMVHAFLPEFAGQSRGIPWSSASLLRQQMLDAYENAALVNAEFGAAKVGVINETEDGAQGLEPDQYDNDGNPEILASAGTFLNTRFGTTADILDTKYPDGEFGDFTKSFKRDIAASEGANYNEFANDYEGVNYSSLRHAAITDREIYKALQGTFVRQVMRPVYRAWLNWQLVLGNITVAGMPLKMSREAKYQNVLWQARRWPWVDLKAEWAAAQIALELRLRSRTEIIRGELGRDPEELFAEIEAENKSMEEHGIAPGAVDAAIFEEKDDDGGEEEE